MIEKREFEVGAHMVDGTAKEEYKKCLVCLKYLKVGEKIVLVPIQKPKGDYFINSVAIPIHTKCHWVEKE